MSGKQRSPALRTSPKYCKACGFKVRGKHHKEGMHHLRVLRSKKVI